MKVCSTCLKEKDEKDFYPSVLKRTKKDSKCRCIECEKEVRRARGYYKRYHQRHKTERNQYCREYDRSNPARQHARRHKSKLAVYGITPDDYDNLYQDQEGCCAICGKHQSGFKRRFGVDHCHKTGRIRGLLCHHCNTALGNLRDDPSLLLSAIEYLEDS